VGKEARDESKKFEVALKSMSADTGLEITGIQRETRKEISECKVRAVLIWTESTRVLGASYTAIEVRWVTT